MKRKVRRKAASPQGPSSCDWQSRPQERKAAGKSTIYRHRRGAYAWKGVKTESYKTEKGCWSRILRKTLVGEGLKAKSHLRYFEIAPDGKSSLEKHRHEHIVIVIRGTGRVLLEKKKHTIRLFDVVYVSPETPHQFSNPYDEPFGFLCIVSARRDRPKVLKETSEV